VPADAAVWIRELRASPQRQAELVGRLGPEDLRRQSYDREWTVAQLLAHMGSNADRGSRPRLGARCSCGSSTAVSTPTTPPWASGRGLRSSWAIFGQSFEGSEGEGMDGYDSATYGDRIADIYDSYSELPADTEEAVDFLAGLAGSGPVLELGVGTGRIALPLQERGVEVHGIDSSERMVERLRAKPGGERMSVAIGDFAEVDVDGAFALVFVVFNTFFALPDQEAQVRCFQRVAAHLRPGGAFVIEAFVPDLARFSGGQNLSARQLSEDRVQLDVSILDPVEQRVRAQHVFLDERGVRLYPVQIRFAWPSELDLMARLAGLQLADRWSGWRREPFTATSRRHVSIYRRP
jgi:SAM-dependent methyltransferase